MSTEGSQTASVLGVILSTLLLSGSVIGLRIFVRWRIQKGALGLDDLFIVITWLTVLAYNICMLISVHYGYGQHRYYISSGDYSLVVKFEVVAQLFAVIAYAPGKVSICICLGRVFPGKVLHAILWAVAIINSILFVGMGVIQLAQCYPVAKQWDPTIEGTCIDPLIEVHYVLPAATVGAFSDFMLAAIPLWYIRGLQVARREKIALSAIMSLGFFAGCFAIVKTYYTTTLSSRTDYAYDTVPLVLWSVGEQCAINLGASLPMLRPLMVKFFGRVRNTSSQRTTRRYLPNGTFGGTGTYRRQPSDIDDERLVEGGKDDLNTIWVEQSIEVMSLPARTPGSVGSRAERTKQ